MTASLELIVAVVPDASLSTLRGKQTHFMFILLFMYPSAYGLILMKYICLCKYLMELLVLAYGYCWFIIRLVGDASALMYLRVFVTVRRGVKKELTAPTSHSRPAICKQRKILCSCSLLSVKWIILKYCCWYMKMSK